MNPPRRLVLQICEELHAEADRAGDRGYARLAERLATERIREGSRGFCPIDHGPGHKNGLLVRP